MQDGPRQSRISFMDQKTDKQQAIHTAEMRRRRRERIIIVATIIGIAAMLMVVGLQLLLISGVLTFAQQGLWVSLAMIVGVGFWLAITGLMARSTGRLPNSVLMSILAVPYLGYPVWAIWLGLHLLSW